MRKISRRGKVILLVCAMAAVAVNAGAAWAYWRVTGTGLVSGTSGSVLALQATGVPSNGARLYPGVRRGLKITVTNPNAFTVRFTLVQRSTAAVVVDNAHATAGCVHSGVQLTNPTYAINLTVPPNGTQTTTVANAITMTNQSDSACQGATFQVPILVTGTA